MSRLNDGGRRVTAHQWAWRLCQSVRGDGIVVLLACYVSGAFKNRLVPLAL